MEHALHDTIITACLETAQSHLDGPEGVLNRALLEQQWALDLDAFPMSPLALPLAPVMSIDAVKYLDVAGDEQLLDPAVYVAHDGRFPSIELADGQCWPELARRSRCVSIEFTAGYEPEAIPERLKSAIKLMVGDLYANVETSGVSQSFEIQSSLTVDRLLFNLIYTPA